MADTILGNGETFILASQPGSSRIFDSDGQETIQINPGNDVELSGLQNDEGDVVKLDGNAGSYTASVSGSTVTLTDGNTTVVVPAGLATNIQFNDTTLELAVDTTAGNVVLGTQVLGSTAESITAAGDGVGHGGLTSDGGGSGGGGSGSGGGSGGSGGTPPSSPGFDETILLTDGDDNEVSAPGANTLFQAAIGNLNDGDQLQGQDGENDTLSAAMSGGESPTPTLSGIEKIEVESLGPVENALNLDTANGVQDITVVDNGSNSAPLAITAVEQTSPTINLTGDEKISVSVKDDSGEVDDTDPVGDEINTTVDGFQGELHLANKIETVNMAAVAASTFDLSQAEDAFNKLVVSGDADTEITSAVSSVYDYTGSTGNNTLVLTDDDPDDSVSVLGGAGDDAVDFTTTMDGVGETGHPNSVDGGSGNDQVWVELNTPIDVQPVIEDVEAIKLQFSVGNSQDATFSAKDVGDTDQGTNPTYIIEESKSQVQLLDLDSPALVEIIGNLEQGALFDAAGNTSITTRFVTETDEDPSIVVEGDLEYRDFDDVTIQNTDSPGFPNPPTGDGQGEVVLENQILLNDASSLTIETTREDDDDADNDGDIVVDGINNRGNDSAIGASQNLAVLTVNAVNGNIFLGDGSVAEDDDALDDASALTDLTVNADNAIAAIGDIGEDVGKPALNLENVNLTGTNRGVINMDDIDAAGSSFKGGPIGGFASGHPYFDGSGALIEDFNVTTAERSFTSTDFDVNGQPIEVANDIDDLEAGLVRNMRLDIAEDGSLSFGEIETNITELNIFGAGDLWMFGASGDNDERNNYPWFVEDVFAESHSGGIMLDFREFTGTDLEDFGSTDFEGTTNILLGDQDTIGTGIRFDSYEFDINVTAGAGDMKATEDLPEFVDVDDASGVPIPGEPADSFYGLVTGFGNDTVHAGAGEDWIASGPGDDILRGGPDADILNGGAGYNVIDLGTQSPGDDAADVHIIDAREQDILPDDPSEENGYDLVQNFEQGTIADGSPQPDVTRLVNTGFDSNPTDDESDPADMPEISGGLVEGPLSIFTSRDVDIFELKDEFGTINLDATEDGLDGTTENFMEENFVSMLEAKSGTVLALNSYFAGVLDGEPNNSVFALVYDNSTDNANAGLFHITQEDEIPDGIMDVTQEDVTAAFNGNIGGLEPFLNVPEVDLVGVYRGVGANQMEASDFEFFDQNPVA